MWLTGSTNLIAGGTIAWHNFGNLTTMLGARLTYFVYPYDMDS